MTMPVGRPPSTNTQALRAARKTRNHALWERNQLLLLWIQGTGLIAHLEPPKRADLLFPAVLCVHTPAGQLTWKLSLEDVDDFRHLPSNGVSHFDGVRSHEKDERLATLVNLAIGPQKSPERGAQPMLDGSTLTFAQYEAIHGLLSAAMAGKAGRGTYAAFVAPDGSHVRLTRYLPRFVARLPKDQAGRVYDPKDGWIFAGTVTKP